MELPPQRKQMFNYVLFFSHLYKDALWEPGGPAQTSISRPYQRNGKQGGDIRIDSITLFFYIFLSLNIDSQYKDIRLKRNNRGLIEKSWIPRKFCFFENNPLIIIKKWVLKCYGLSESESVSHSVMRDSLRTYGLQPARLFCPWNSPSMNTGLGCHSLLQGIILTQGSNPGLLHCRKPPYLLRLD